MNTPKTSVSASEAKLHFGDYLSQCIYGRNLVYITKHDKEVAVLVSIQDWEGEEPSHAGPMPHPFLKKMRKARADYLAKGGKAGNGSSAAALVRQLRDERAEELWQRSLKKK